MALRLLYGFLTYFDSLGGPQSPAGTYEDFLVSLDRRVRGALKPEDAFAFLDHMTGHTPDTPRVVFVLMDEFNAAKGPFPVSKIPSSALVIHHRMLDHVLPVCRLRGWTVRECGAVQQARWAWLFLARH